MARKERAGFLPVHAPVAFQAWSAIPMVTKPSLASPASSISMFWAGPSVANRMVGRFRLRVRILATASP
jgi:hypothetical protein